MAIASRKNYNFKRKVILTTVLGSSLVCPVKYKKLIHYD
jgi:hypothetical protein